MPSYYTTAGGTGDAVWYYWTSSGTSATVDCSTGTWDRWISGTTSCTAAATATVIWTRWNESGTVIVPQYVQARRPELTAEERARMEADRKEREEKERVRQKEEEKKRKAASKRARELLLANLSKEQREQFSKDKTFKVIGGDGAFFEIGLGRSGNVREVDKDGKGIARFCIHPAEMVPDEDTMLAQKLLLETDPASFRKIANRTPIPAGAAQ